MGEGNFTESKLHGSLDILHSFQVTEEMENVDRTCKELYKNKEVLAIILKGVAREFENYRPAEIMDFIEADSITDLEKVSPGHGSAGGGVNTNTSTDTRIIGDDKEFVALNEKLSLFDTKFRAVNPELSDEEITVNLHFDIEPQTTYRPGYPIEKRGLYYLARELSAQLSLVTENTDYGCLEKCYSIWICRDDVPQKERFSISFFEFSNTLNYGECYPRKDDYDLLTLVIIRLGDSVFRGMEKADMPAEKNGMMEFLHAIMYPHTKDFLTTVKKYIDFSENEELWRESDNMTGLGMCIAKESWQEGRQSGLEEGRQERERNKKLLAEKDDMLAEKDGMLAEKDGMLAEKEDMLAEKDAIIESLKRQLAECL